MAKSTPVRTGHRLWVAKSPQGIVATAIKWIGFYMDDQFGLAVCSIAGSTARVVRTTDGGATWGYSGVLNANITGNAGLNSAFIADQNTFIVCGEPVTSIVYVAEAQSAIQAPPA